MKPFSLGEKLMIALIIQYLITSGTFAAQGVWLKALYWIGAAIITTSVLFMGR